MRNVKRRVKKIVQHRINLGEGLEEVKTD
jgi:hypothetical protein